MTTPTPASSEPGVRRTTALVASWSNGFAVMCAEIAAGRLLAPYYGTSTTVWAVLIATVLGGLSLGNVLGGRLSRRVEPIRCIGWATLVAALLLALVPHLGRWLLAGSLTRFQEGHFFALGAALALVALLLALPIVLSGMVSPLLLHAIGIDQNAAHLRTGLGRVAGELGAASTAGSLIGTLGSGLVFIPWIGTTRTLCLASAALASTAALLRWEKARRVDGRAVIVLCAVLAASLAGRAARAGHGNVMWEKETPYQHLAVLQLPEERQLRVNEGYAVQSFAFLDGRLPLRSVWAYYALAPSLAAKPDPRRALLLGLGGGTTAAIYRSLFPQMDLTGVELDAAMVGAGKEALGIDLSGVRVVIDDARVFASHEKARSPNGYDVIVLDAFQFPYVPFHLTTREFFADLDALLADGGVVMVNVGRNGEHREVVHAVACTLGAIFPHVLEADAPGRSNTLLAATRHAFDDAVGLRFYSPAARHAIETTTTRMTPFRPATWPSRTPLLTDDRAPIEWMTDRIVWQSLFEATKAGNGS